MKTLIAFLLLGAAYGYPGKRSAAADEGSSYLRGEYERNDDEGHENALGNYGKREAEAEADPGRKRGYKCRGKREAEPGCYRGKREAEAEAIPGRKRVYKPKCRGKRQKLTQVVSECISLSVVERGRLSQDVTGEKGRLKQKPYPAVSESISLSVVERGRLTQDVTVERGMLMLSQVTSPESMEDMAIVVMDLEEETMERGRQTK